MQLAVARASELMVLLWLAVPRNGISFKRDDNLLAFFYLDPWHSGKHKMYFLQNKLLKSDFLFEFR